MYTLVDQAVQYPFKCAITGSEVGPFVDTGVNYETATGVYPEARIYIATVAVAELAQLAGQLGDIHVTAQHEQAIYNRGKLDAVREGLGNDVHRVADSLAAAAVYLLGSVAAVGADEDDPIADPFEQ
jgi:hypothetical protein